ncbi:hypothetical protein V1509DRAFT_623327 [Lipomyces kononenkoae]
MAAMHDGALQTSAKSSTQENYQEAYHYHISCAAALLNERLSRSSFNIAADRNAIWTTAAVLSSLASFAREAYNPELAWPLCPSSSSSLDWMDMHKGISVIYRLVSPVGPGGMFHDLIADPNHSFLVNKWIEDKRDGIEGIPPQFVTLCGLTPASNVHNSPYHATVRALAAIWDMECTPLTGFRFITFISLLQPEMKALLVQKDPRALVLLAYWYTKIFNLHFWWHQRAVIECAAICIYLKRYHYLDPLVMDMLQYPLSRLDELNTGIPALKPLF